MGRVYCDHVDYIRVYHDHVDYIRVYHDNVAPDRS
jgi:hypothetical protein